MGTGLLLVLPVALVDAIFYWWALSALTRTLAQLASRRQSAKLHLYRRFSHALLGLVVCSALWAAHQIGVLVRDDELDTRYGLRHGTSTRADAARDWPAVVLI